MQKSGTKRKVVKKSMQPSVADLRGRKRCGRGLHKNGRMPEWLAAIFEMQGLFP
jgi:hypothetical protein